LLCNAKIIIKNYAKKALLARAKEGCGKEVIL
jgi:hypothetical protein